MLRPAFVLGLVAGLTLALPACAQRGYNPAQSMILLEKEAIALDVPELVAPGVVEEAAWSPSGQYALLRRMRVSMAAALRTGTPFQESALCLWTNGGPGAGKEARELWKTPGGEGSVGTMRWLEGADVALAVVQQAPAPPRPVPGAPRPPAPPAPERWVVRIDARRGILKPILAAGHQTEVITAPGQPRAALTDAIDRILAVVQPDGTVRNYSAQVARWIVTDVSWSEDAAQLRFRGTFVPEDGGKPQSAWYSLEVASGRVAPLPKPPAAVVRATPAEPPLQLVSGRAVVSQEKSAQPVRPLWLECRAATESPRVLVTADSPWGLLSPRADAILYTSEGALFVRRVVHIDKAVFQAARGAAERQVLIANLKQIGLGLIMWAADNQDQLPPSGTDIPSALGQYFKAPSLFNGFVYTFSGGPIKDIAEPARTELGYTPGAGGRAVVFADGHVVWRPDGAQ